MKKWILLVCMCMCACCGCSDVKKSENVSKLDYTIVKEEEVPTELKKILEEKREKPFKLTFEDKEVLYIAMGYGERAGGGYSVQVKEAAVGSNAIYFGTELIGPKKEEVTPSVKSYPYIVIQTKRHTQPVVFQ